MLTVRSFRNEDPPRLLELWEKNQKRPDPFGPPFPLSLNQFQTQILGLPMLDSRSLILAFDGDTPIGYIHTTFAPSKDGYGFNTDVGHICFLCVDPNYSDAFGAASSLIQAGEAYLANHGAKTIYAGSPSPSAPFYTGFYGGGEAVGILYSDETCIHAFQSENYQIHQKTCWYHYNIHDSLATLSSEMASCYSIYAIEISEVGKAKNWWEGCVLAYGMWFDALAFPIKENRPVARLRVRIAYPDVEHVSALYGGTWLASLVELRIRPDFSDDRMQTLLLSELLRYLVAHNQVVRIEAQAAKDSPLDTLLQKQGWQTRNTGVVMVKHY